MMNPSKIIKATKNFNPTKNPRYQIIFMNQDLIILKTFSIFLSIKIQKNPLNLKKAHRLKEWSNKAVRKIMTYLMS